MKAEDLLKKLQKMDGMPKTLPSWPLPKSVIEGLLRDPQASSQYINDRLNKCFADRTAIGEHLQSFSEVSGITRSNLSILNLEMNLQTRPTQKATEREEALKAARDHKLRVLDAACAVIAGIGSPKALESDYGVNYMTTYKKIRAELAKDEMQILDLKHMTTPKRKALALKVEKRCKAEIEESFRKYSLDAE